MPTLRSLIRQPITWIVVAEVVLVLGFLLAAWRLWEDRQRVATVPVPIPVPSSPRHVPATSPPQPVLAPTPTPYRPGPGVSSDPAFIARQIQALNKDASAAEAAEWEVARSVMEWARRYFDNSVLPRVEQAARGDGRR
jgi:hypothetical protein